MTHGTGVSTAHQNTRAEAQRLDSLKMFCALRRAFSGVPVKFVVAVAGVGPLGCPGRPGATRRERAFLTGQAEGAARSAMKGSPIPSKSKP